MARSVTYSVVPRRNHFQRHFMHQLIYKKILLGGSCSSRQAGFILSPQSSVQMRKGITQSSSSGNSKTNRHWYR